MGKYHPHGDLAIYDTMVRLAQPLALRYPLVDRPGQLRLRRWRSAGGRSIHRSACSLGSRHALLEDLDKDTVDIRPNYDGSEVEPDVLPDAHSQPDRERFRRNRRRHGDKHSATQSHGNRQRDHRAGEQSQHAQLAEHSEVRAGPGLPYRRHHLTVAAGIRRSLQNRPRTLHHARQGRHRNDRRRTSRPSSSPKFRTRSTRRGSSSASPTW